MSKIIKAKDNAWFFAANFFNNRPLCFMSTVGGLRDFLIGLAFLLQLDQITRTQLYNNYNDLIPGTTGYLAGLLFALFGLYTMLWAVVDNVPRARVGLRFQAFAWLFSGIMYAAEGNWVLAIALGFYFSFMAGYLAFYYKYAPLWRQQKREFRDKWIREHDPFAYITDRA